MTIGRDEKTSVIRAFRILLSGALAFALAFALACSATSDPQHPGVPLGTFRVSASQTTNTCGAGALGSTPTWTFDVKLSRGDHYVFWDNGAQLISAPLAGDRVSFTFETGVLVDMRKDDPGSPPPCSIHRVDKASGKLDAAGEGVTSFQGSLSYEFTQEPIKNSDCSDLLTGSMPVLATLPCAMSYELEAKLSVAPSPSGSSAETQGSGSAPPE